MAEAQGVLLPMQSGVQLLKQRPVHAGPAMLELQACAEGGLTGVGMTAWCRRSVVNVYAQVVMHMRLSMGCKCHALAKQLMARLPAQVLTRNETSCGPVCACRC